MLICPGQCSHQLICSGHSFILNLSFLFEPLYWVLQTVDENLPSGCLWTEYSNGPGCLSPVGAGEMLVEVWHCVWDWHYLSHSPQWAQYPGNKSGVKGKPLSCQMRQCLPEMVKKRTMTWTGNIKNFSGIGLLGFAFAQLQIRHSIVFLFRFLMSSNMVIKSYYSSCSHRHFIFCLFIIFSSPPLSSLRWRQRLTLAISMRSSLCRPSPSHRLTSVSITAVCLCWVLVQNVVQSMFC